MLIGSYICHVRIENLYLSKKITLGICTSVACVLLIRMNNTILTISSQYRCGSKRHLPLQEKLIVDLH
jgi:hypothetical protein